jgi:hypothetical protein
VIRYPSSAFTIDSSTPTLTPNFKKHPLLLSRKLYNYIQILTVYKERSFSGRKNTNQCCLINIHTSFDVSSPAGGGVHQNGNITDLHLYLLLDLKKKNEKKLFVRNFFHHHFLSTRPYRCERFCMFTIQIQIQHINFCLFKTKITLFKQQFTPIMKMYT